MLRLLICRTMGHCWLRSAGRHGLLQVAPGISRSAVVFPRHVNTTAAAAAAGSSSSSSSDLASRIKDDMKVAMKARDAPRLEAIRFLSAAIKQREIELRESGKQVTDADVLSVIQKMAKQRRDSIQQYAAGGRTDLADKETQELGVLQGYLPAQMNAAELAAVVAAVVAETGASSMKDMGRVMKAVSARIAGQADGKAVSELVKATLSSLQQKQ